MDLSSREVLAVLSKSKIRVQVAETYYFTKGKLELGVYTDSEGRCRRVKVKEPKSTAEILAELNRGASPFTSSNKKVCFCYTRKSKKCLTSDEIEARLNKPLALPFTCLQSYIESRTGDEDTLKLSISLQDNTYVTRWSPIPGVRQLGEQQIKQKMLEVAKGIMHFFQEIEVKYVEILELEFIQDIYKRLWLINVVDCKLAIKPGIKGLDISKTVTCYERTNEVAMPILIDLKEAILLESSVETIPTPKETNLPMISQIYEQLKNRPSPRIRRKKHLSVSTFDPISEDNKPKQEPALFNLVNFLAKSIQAPVEEKTAQTTMSSAFNEVLSKYIKIDQSDTLLGFSMSRSDLSPTRLISPINCNSPQTEPIEPTKNHKEDKRSLSYSRMPKSRFRLTSNLGVRRNASIYQAETQVYRLDKVIEKLDSRQKELQKKYGQIVKVPKTSHSPTKSAVSPYANLSIKFLS